MIGRLTGTLYDKTPPRIGLDVQGVGYEGLNGSHFKSTDLWMSGGDGTPANFNIRSGWMARAPWPQDGLRHYSPPGRRSGLCP